MRLLFDLRTRMTVLALTAAQAISSPALAQVDPTGGVGGGSLAGTLTVTVVDRVTAAPIPGAFCQVGTSPGSPFSGNLKITSALGQAVFTNGALTGAQTVSVGKDGYNYLTMFGVNAAQMILPIGVKDAQPPKALYQGDITSGFTLVSNDGQLDVAIVLPVLSIAGLNSLSDFGQFAPIVLADFPAAPDTPVSGNTYMPTQVELLFAVIERKPYYLWLPDQTTQDIFAFYGRISLATLVANLTTDNPDLVGLAQGFDMRRVGLTQGVVVNGPGTRNFTLPNSVSENLRIRVANSPSGTDVFLVAAADLDSLSGLGDIVPCGINAVPGGTTVVKTLDTINPGGTFVGMNYVAAAVASDTALGLANTLVTDRTGLVPSDTAHCESFFLAPVPSVTPNGLTYSWTSVFSAGISPAPSLNLAEIALTKTIADTNPGAQPGDTLDFSTPLWEFYVSGLTTSFTIPTLGPNVTPGIVSPASTADQDRLDWTITGAGLTLAPSFSYDDWDFEDRVLEGTHAAWNTQTFIPFPAALYTGVESQGGAGQRVALGDAAPNPFSRSTAVAFRVPDSAVNARLEVYDLTGRRVRVLVDGGETAKRGSAVWDGLDDAGRRVAPGSYLLRLEAGGTVVSSKVTRLP